MQWFCVALRKVGRVVYRYIPMGSVVGKNMTNTP